MELTKKKRKIAHKIIDSVIPKEFEIGLKLADAALQKWKDEKGDPGEHFRELFRTVLDFDTHIARRYDYLRGSRYMETVADQLRDGLITEDELSEFSELSREAIIRYSKWSSVDDSDTEEQQ